MKYLFPFLNVPCSQKQGDLVRQIQGLNVDVPAMVDEGDDSVNLTLLEEFSLTVFKAIDLDDSAHLFHGDIWDFVLLVVIPHEDFKGWQGFPF